MADVVAKAISANDVKLGSILLNTGQGKPTHFDVDDDHLETEEDNTILEGRYTIRFDDPTYYG